MFYLGDKTPSVEEGSKLAQKMIANGSAFEKFCELTELQGGDPESLRDIKKLPQAKHRRDVRSQHSGQVQAINCEKVGIASLVLGGGREKKEDSIDPAVGIVLHKKVGDAISENEAICTLYYNSEARLSEAESLIHSSYRIGPEKAKAREKLIKRVIEGKAASSS
jgi:thymidine phosphorylase